MKNMRLFDRIRYGNNTSSGSFDDSSRMTVDSVVDHLKKLLNTRQGSTLMDSAYGMPDLMEFRAALPDSVTEIQKLISRTITTYEPRLKDVSVEFMFQDDAQTLFFQILAVLDRNKNAFPVSLESTLDTGGRMGVNV